MLCCIYPLMSATSFRLKSALRFLSASSFTDLMSFQNTLKSSLLAKLRLNSSVSMQRRKYERLLRIKVLRIWESCCRRLQRRQKSLWAVILKSWPISRFQNRYLQKGLTNMSSGALCLKRPRILTTSLLKQNLQESGLKNQRLRKHSLWSKLRQTVVTI